MPLPIADETHSQRLESRRNFLLGVVAGYSISLIHIECGSQRGPAMHDWLEAEYELMQLPVPKIVELGALQPRRRDGNKLPQVSLLEASVMA